MEIKGTGIKTTREFVITNFPLEYHNWIESLPLKSRALFVSPVLNLTGWFPIKESYLVPMEKIIEKFYNGNQKLGGEALGKFSAELALTGIYKLFIMVASPRYMMQRATTILTTYYVPCEIKAVDNSSKSISLIITSFPELNKTLEYRIAGWVLKAFELCHCKNPKYTIPKSLVDGDTETEFAFTWE